MFTPRQRILILKWSSVGLVFVSFMPLMAHGLLYFSIMQLYLQFAIIAGLSYIGFKTSKRIWEW